MEEERERRSINYDLRVCEKDPSAGAKNNVHGNVGSKYEHDKGNPCDSNYLGY